MEDETYEAEIDEMSIRELSADWINGIMEERTAVLGMIDYALGTGNFKGLDGNTSLDMLKIAIGMRTEVVG